MSVLCFDMVERYLTRWWLKIDKKLVVKKLSEAGQKQMKLMEGGENWMEFGNNLTQSFESLVH